MKIQYTRINHYTITAPLGTEEKALWFYRDILGLKVIEIPGDVASVYKLLWFDLADITVHIEFTRNHVVPKEEVTDEGAILPGRHLALEIKDIEKVHAYFKKKGIEIREALDLKAQERFYIIDPFGNVYGFMEI